MDQNQSSEANPRLANEEIPLLLWHRKVRRRVNKSPPQQPVLSQMNPVHVFTPCLFNAHFIIMISSARMFPNFSFPLGFSD
jgi:hypothetical protein